MQKLSKVKTDNTYFFGGGILMQKTCFILFLGTLSYMVKGKEFHVSIDYSNYRLNQLQYLGTHNSYKQSLIDDLLLALTDWNASLAQSLDYEHPPLHKQLHNYGVRQIELDLFADPQGGHYARRMGLVFIGKDPQSQIKELYEPGFKVMHVQDIDFETRCLTFKECLRQIKYWSENHANHLPLAIMIELKDQKIPDPFEVGFAKPIPTTNAILDDIDKEILAVFERDHILTPDDIRKDFKTLREAIMKNGWPFIKDIQGKVYFIFDCSKEQRKLYLQDYPALQKRIMFTATDPDRPESAFLIINSPLKNKFLKIKSLVKKGYMVRTRADYDTKQARSGDTLQRDLAWASGAHFISTDYIEPSNKFGTNYQVVVPGGGVVRCNEIVSPKLCR